MRGSKYIVMRNTLENNRKPCINPAHNMWSGMAAQSWTYRWAVRVTKNVVFFLPYPLCQRQPTSTGTTTPTEPKIASRKFVFVKGGLGRWLKLFCFKPVSLWPCSCNRHSNFLTNDFWTRWKSYRNNTSYVSTPSVWEMSGHRCPTQCFDPPTHIWITTSAMCQSSRGLLYLLLLSSHISLFTWIFTQNYLGPRYKPVFPAVWHFPPCILIQSYTKTITFLSIDFAAEHSNTQPSHTAISLEIKKQFTHQIVGGSDPSTSR